MAKFLKPAIKESLLAHVPKPAAASKGRRLSIGNIRSSVSRPSTPPVATGKGKMGPYPVVSDDRGVSGEVTKAPRSGSAPHGRPSLVQQMKGASVEKTKGKAPRAASPRAGSPSRRRPSSLVQQIKGRY